jgi:hypothetical protein
MPHYLGLVQMVLRVPERVNALGQIHLSSAEAGYVRGLDFSNVSEGNWQLPEWPDFVLRVYPELGRLTEEARRREQRVIQAPPLPEAPSPLAIKI